MQLSLDPLTNLTSHRIARVISDGLATNMVKKISDNQHLEYALRANQGILR